MSGQWYVIIALVLLAVGTFTVVLSDIIRVARHHDNRIDLATRTDWFEILGVLLLSGGGFVLAFLTVGSGRFWVLEVPLRLAVGWVQYLDRVSKAVQPDAVSVTSAVVCLAGTIVGAHLFLRWLAASASRSWPVKRTLQVLLLVVLMFASGVAVAGLVQQTGWLIRTPEPLVKDNRSLS